MGWLFRTHGTSRRRWVSRPLGAVWACAEKVVEAVEELRGRGGSLESVHIFRAGGGRTRKKVGKKNKAIYCCQFIISTLQMGKLGLSHVNGLCLGHCVHQGGAVI